MPESKHSTQLFLRSSYFFHLIEIYMLILSESALGQNLQIGLKVQQGEWIHAMHSECCSSENCNNHHRFRWTKVIFAMEDVCNTRVNVYHDMSHVCRIAF